MWSFGLMKHSTCAYGAISRVKGLPLYQKLIDLQKSYNVSPPTNLLEKVRKGRLFHNKF